MKQIDYDSAQREEETFPFLRKCEQNCNHGAKVQKHIEKHRLRIFDLHKVTEDNQMCGAADRQEFRDSWIRPEIKLLLLSFFILFPYFSLL